MVNWESWESSRRICFIEWWLKIYLRGEKEWFIARQVKFNWERKVRTCRLELNITRGNFKFETLNKRHS